MENATTQPDPDSDTRRTDATRLGSSDFVAELSQRYPHWDREPTEAERKQQEERERQRQRDRVLQLRIERQDMVDAFLRDVGARYRNCTLDSFEATTAKQKGVIAAMQEYADELPDRVRSGDGVVLFGPSGTGKDHLLVGMGRQAIAKYGVTVAWVNGADLFARFRDSMDGDETEARIVRQYTTSRILILSDPVPPRGQLSDYQASTLLRIIDQRYRRCYPTWATLNVATGQEADDRIGAALVDRLRDGAVCCHCDWQSHRRTQQQAAGPSTFK